MPPLVSYSFVNTVCSVPRGEPACHILATQKYFQINGLIIDFSPNKETNRDERVSKSFALVEAADPMNRSREEDRGRRSGCGRRRSKNADREQLCHLNDRKLREDKPLHFGRGEF